MPSYISNIQVPPTITMSEHVAAHDPHPKYLLAENLVSSINVQVSLEDLNDILIEENTELNNTVLVHNSGSWEPVSVSTLLVSAIPYATTENSGTVKLAVDEDIASKNTATVVTPNLLYPYFTRYDSAINELISRADSAVTRIPAATEVLPGIARLATENDINNNTDSTIVTPPLLNGVSGTLSAAIDLKQNVLTAGAMINATALDNNTVEVTGAQPTLATNGRFTELVNGNTVNCTLKGGTNTEIDPDTGEINCILDNMGLLGKMMNFTSAADESVGKADVGVESLTGGQLLLPFTYNVDGKSYNLVIEWGLSTQIDLEDDDPATGAVLPVTNPYYYLMIDNYGYYRIKKMIYALVLPKLCGDFTHTARTNYGTDIIAYCGFKPEHSLGSDGIASLLVLCNRYDGNNEGDPTIRLKWIAIGLADKTETWPYNYAGNDALDRATRAASNIMATSNSVVYYQATSNKISYDEKYI